MQTVRQFKTENQKAKGTHTDTDRQRYTDTDTQTQTQTHKHTHTHTLIDRETQTQTQTHQLTQTRTKMHTEHTDKHTETHQHIQIHHRQSCGRKSMIHAQVQRRTKCSIDLCFRNGGQKVGDMKDSRGHHNGVLFLCGILLHSSGGSCPSCHSSVGDDS